MIIEIPQSDFVAWKKDPVTNFIFKYLAEVKEHYLMLMVSKEYIGSITGHLKLNELRGYLDAIEDLLNLDVFIEEDLVTTEEEENEKSKSSWI